VSVYIYILMVIAKRYSSAVRRLTNQNEEWLITGFTSGELNWSEDSLNIWW